MIQDKNQTWSTVLAEEKKSSFFSAVLKYIHNERSTHKTIYPAPDKVFNAFKLTPFADVSVVLLGQDPYHGAGQAEGLSFSVPRGIAIPPSLQNIYKELHDDIGCTTPDHGHLEHWATQGVLLLNSVLTVEAGKPGSHAGHGWEQFTDTVIRILSEKHSGLVFLLWGNYAKNKQYLIDSTRHTILTATHPSPFSAYNGFFGCKHFSKTNTALKHLDLPPINWEIPS